MTYQIGQKILVEATVVQPSIDGDGDIRVDFPSDVGVFVPAADSREIPVEPKLIAFGDVRVGDEVRTTTKCTDGTLIVYVGTVTGVPSKNIFHIGNGRSQWIDTLEDDAIELISRPEPPPTPEPQNIGAVVLDARGDMSLRVPSVSARDTYVWFSPVSGGFCTWDELKQPIEIKHPGWVDNTV